MISTYDGLLLTLKQYYGGPEGSNRNKKETANKKKKKTQYIKKRKTQIRQKLKTNTQTKKHNTNKKSNTQIN